MRFDAHWLAARRKGHPDPPRVGRPRPGGIGGLTQKSSSYFFGRTLSRERARSRRFTPVFFLRTDTVVPGTDARKTYLIGKL
jgi:hypothetical protein